LERSASSLYLNKKTTHSSGFLFMRRGMIYKWIPKRKKHLV
jgi:hypothetical protein